MNNTNTNVLLLIIPNPSSTILPHSVFYKLFSEYGDVAKILIFEKARVWKAFIEMGSDSQTKNAQKNLNGMEVIEGITMNVYFSALKSVTFLNNNCGGVDYSQMKNKNEEKKKLQLQQGTSQSWYSQPDLGLKYNADFNHPTFHSVQNMNMPNQDFKFKSSNSIENFQSSESLLTPRSQNEKTGNFKPLRRKTSIEKIWADAQGYQPYSKILTTHEILSKIKEEEMIRSESSEYYLNAVNKLSSKKVIKNSDYGQANESSEDEEHKQSDDECMKMKEQEGLSPEGQNIMNAFQSSSNYIYNVPSEPSTAKSDSSRRMHRSSTYKDRGFNLQNEMSAQLSALNLSDFQMLMPPNLNPSRFSNSQPTTQTKIPYDSEDIIDPFNYVNPQFLIENQPSKVIYIRGLQHPALSPVNIFNLLSNCGNVMVIIYIKQKSSVLVQFEKLQQAQNAKDHLNNMLFFGQKLKIFYSNYQQIQFPLPYQSPQTMVYIPSKDQFRFGEGKSISFNPPSQTLHLSNIKMEVTENDDFIRDLFRGVGNVQAIKFIHLNQQKHMALVKLDSVEEAMNGAALLHGRDLFGRKLNVSFTKSKL